MNEGIVISKVFPVSNETIRLAMVGMVPGNGHPYSWSAIFNGYYPEEFAKSPFPGIVGYLNKEPKDKLRIQGARVTHICCNDPADAVQISKAALIDNVARNPEDVIGHVDAVIIATDKGFEHVDRCRPFVDAGLPVFVDKPMVDNEQDLKTFCKWVSDGKAILSSSCMRYAKEFAPYRMSTNNLGELRYAGMTMAMTWERYGIHALEGIYPIVGPGFISVRNTGDIDHNVVHLKHASGADVVLIVNKDMFGGFGLLTLAGTEGNAQAAWSDSFFSFKAQLQSFIDYLRTGTRPFPFEETIELMKMVIAGTRSREDGGREVFLSEISET